jgi:hypothetical protein
MSKASTDTASSLKAPKQAAIASPEPAVKAAASPSKRAPAKSSASNRSNAKAAPEGKQAKSKPLTAKPPKAEKPSSKPGVAAAKGSQDKIKDRFSMPAADHALIAALKNRAKAAGHPVKKSELLRAGLHALNLLDETQLLQAVARLHPTR